MNFSLRLKDLREQKGLSQAQLAKALNVSNGCVGMWESTKQIPPASRLDEISKFFGVSVDYLLGRDDWTDEEKANGIGRYATYLTSDDWDWQELKNEIIEVHGEAYFKTLFATLKALNKL